MSLRPDDRSSRRRDKSATRDRSRSRSNVRSSAPRAPSPPSSAAYGYAPSSTMPGAFSNGAESPTYEVRAPAGAKDRKSSTAQPRYPPPPPAGSVPYPSDDGGFTMGDYTDFPPEERPGYVPRARFPSFPSLDDDDLAYGDPGAARGNMSRQGSYSNNPYPQDASFPSMPSDASYRYTPQTNQETDSRGQPYTYQYAQPPEKLTYSAKPHGTQEYTQNPKDPRQNTKQRTYSQDYRSDAQYVEIKPGQDPRDKKGNRLTVNAQPGRPASPGLSSRMDRLSVSGNRPDMNFGGGGGGGGGLPPPSPLLEAYHGTWQSISPAPLQIRGAEEDDFSDLELERPHKDKKNDKLRRDADKSKSKSKSSKDDKDSKDKEKKRVKLYDPEADAGALASALKHSKIDADKIIDVLPGLSHDQIWEVRKEYKKQVRIQGKGINLPKHLKMKLSGNFGKAVYVTALGRWESEGYWANFWYQSHGSRRELLIESLMGRTNSEMGYIKDEFKDKRYSDSLVKCMEKELKMDKFRTAVLMALEERRQDEQDVYPVEYRNRDVDTLRRALVAKQGGESAMLDVIIRRSDAHLREVLRTYERMFQENFARAALKKSNNLVGEVIAHILNGVINKPARDALLLRHAIQDIANKNKDEELRYELLISRLVRLHWDKMHLLRVRKEYQEKFGKDLQEDIEDSTKGDFREFMCELCEVQQAPGR